MKKAAINTVKQVSLWKERTCICPGVVQLGLKVGGFSVFWETAILISKVAIQACTHTSRIEGMHQKKSGITSHLGNANPSHTETPPHTTQKTLYCWREVKTTATLTNNSQFLKRLNMTPAKPAIPQLGSLGREMKRWNPYRNVHKTKAASLTTGSQRIWNPLHRFSKGNKQWSSTVHKILKFKPSAEQTGSHTNDRMLWNSPLHCVNMCRCGWLN